MTRCALVTGVQTFARPILPHTRLYAGERLRALRRGLVLGQPAMAARLGLSVSYLSQLENDARPLTAAVITALRRHHPAETAAIEGERSEEHTSELQSLMRISYAVFCLKTHTKQWRRQ